MPKIPRKEWTELICEALAGDQDAFTKLHTDFTPVVKRAVKKYCKLEDLEDVTQLAWLQIFKKLDTFEGTAAFSTWIHRIAINTALMVYRNGKNRALTNAVSIDAPIRQDNGSEAKFEIPIEVKEYEFAGDLAKLRRLIQELPPGMRSIWMLRLDGWELGEIATTLGCTQGNVKSQLFRGKEILRRGMMRMDTVVNEQVETVNPPVVVGKRFCRCNCGTLIGPVGWPHAKGHGVSLEYGSRDCTRCGKNFKKTGARSVLCADCQAKPVKTLVRRKVAPPVIEQVAEPTYSGLITGNQLDRFVIGLPTEHKLAAVRNFFASQA